MTSTIETTAAARATNMTETGRTTSTTPKPVDSQGDYTTMRSFLADDQGMTTLEYALGSLVAAALAAVLYMVVNSGGVTDAFESIITDALNKRPS